MTEMKLIIKPPIKQLFDFIGDRKFLKKPVTELFDRAGILISTNAKNLAPKDRGNLVRAIKYRVEKKAIPMWTKIGIADNPGILPQAASMEFGTGLRNDNPEGGGTGRPHFPPPAALEDWAIRHGFPNGYVVALAIFRKGGLKPRRYLRQGLEDYAQVLPAEIRRTERRIEQEWNRFG